jgi:signal peptidase I
VAEPPAEAEGGRGRARAAGRDGAGVAAGEQRKPGPPHGVLREYFESLVVTAVMALFGMTFVVQAVKVPTGSMQNTINIGDHLLVNKFIFAPGPILPFLPQREIERGDVIVFKYPGKYQGEERFRESGIDDTLPNNLPYKTNYVKRVIGLPGDVLEVRGTDVYINGQPLPEHKVAALNPPDNDDPSTSGDERGAPLKDEQGTPLVGEHAPAPAPGAESTYNVFWQPESLKQRAPAEGDKFIVPEGHYFAMGDNRDNSQDSRFWGYVPRHAIIGRAMFVYWSYDESAPRSTALKPFNYLPDFIYNTRWRRTGTFVK